jgi:hypothetical protein
MTETVKRVTVISPSINAVKVRVNSGLPPRVQSIQYLPNPLDFQIKDATDVEISNNLTGRGVLTYNQTTQEFVVQDVPRLDGGTY